MSYAIKSKVLLDSHSPFPGGWLFLSSGLCPLLSDTAREAEDHP